MNEREMTAMPVIGQLLQLSLTTRWQHQAGELHMVLYVMNGKADVRCGAYDGFMHEGDLLVLPAGAGVCVVEPVALPVTAFYLTFAMAHVERIDGEWSARGAEPPLQGVRRVEPVSIVHHRFSELQRRWREDGPYTLLLHMAWLELWETIRTGVRATRRDDADALMRDIIRHMDTHYTETFQIEEMAKYSGIAPAAFFQHFKEYTSLSPLQYITKRRMDKARSLLADNGKTVQEAAAETGYQDVYYFGRMFKKIIGLPPGRYQRAMRRRVAVLAPPLFGNLLALGVPRELLIPLWNRDEQKVNYRQFESFDMELPWLESVKPDLIFGTDKYSPLYDRLSAIAPTRLIRFKPLPWRQHLLEMAQMLDAREAAESWLLFYEQQAASARERIHRRLGDSTIIAAVVTDSKVRAFGTRGRKVGQLLYNDLRLRAPAGAEQFAFVDMDGIAELNTFNADHILLFCAHKEMAREEGQLRAQVHYGGIFPWLHYSAYGHEMAVRSALQLFTT